MRISFELNVKAVLAVITAGALSAGSFYAGRHYERTHPHVLFDMSKAVPVPDEYNTPIPKGATLGGMPTLTIPSGADFNKDSWCRQHPLTNWTYSAEGMPSSFVPLTGLCDERGHVLTFDGAPVK
jgi:hypothetical protein